tara:strand:+ start:6362 stop:6841 length:480 start_codon:yes stop_codon:yes gene_type:complete
MYKKTLSIILAFLMTAIPVFAHAEEASPTVPSLSGRVTDLSLGQPAPYSGVLLDPIAASRMLVDQKYLKLETELKLRKEFQSQLASKRLAFDLLKSEHDALKKIHVETLKIRDQQITDLNLLLKEEMGSDNTHWWVLGGVAIGIVLSIATFYASVEIAK